MITHSKRKEAGSVHPAVTRVHCPILAFYRTYDDVGTQKDLDLLSSYIKRLPNGPSRVDTILIKGADHMYTGQELQVAQKIALWCERL